MKLDGEDYLDVKQARDAINRAMNELAKTKENDRVRALLHSADDRLRGIMRRNTDAG